MAYTEAQLKAQLANAQRNNNNSQSSQATIARITNELNALKTPTTPKTTANTATPAKTTATTTTPTTTTKPTASTASISNIIKATEALTPTLNKYTTTTTSTPKSTPIIPQSTAPQYDFTKTPDQNAVKGNTAGYSYTKNQEQPVAQIQPVQPIQPQQDVSQFQNIINSLKTQQNNLTSQYQADIKQRDQAYNDILEAKRQAVRSAIQKAQGTFQKQIQNAPQQFQDQRNNIAVNQSQNLQNIRKSLANLGYNPDSYVTRGEMQNINVGAQGQINQLDIAQQQLIQDAQNSITELEAQGNIDDANAVAEIANQKMQALDNLRNQYMNQANVYNRDVTDNVYRLMEYNRTMGNDTADRLYKEGVLKNTAIKNAQDYQAKSDKDYYDFITESEKNKTTANKNKWEASGYMLPDWAQEEIPSDVKQYLSQFSDNYADAANRLEASGQPELAQWARVASMQKMSSNPDLMYQYGKQYMTQNAISNYLKNQETQTKTMGAEIDNLIKNTELAYKEPMLRAQLQKDYEAISKAQTENQYLPQKMMTEINQNIASAKASLMNASTNAYSAETGRMNTGLREQELGLNREKFNYDKTKKEGTAGYYADLAEDISDAKNNPDKTLEQLKTDKKTLIDTYGDKYYAEVYKAATDAKRAKSTQGNGIVVK